MPCLSATLHTYMILSLRESAMATCIAVFAQHILPFGRVEDDIVR